MCTNIFLDTSNTNSISYVHEMRSLCFSCQSCDREVTWDLISYQGHRWTGRNGERTHLGSFSAEVFENGTLLILNSSLVFSQNQPGTLKFQTSADQANISSVYNIYIHGMFIPQSPVLTITMFLSTNRGCGSVRFMHDSRKRNHPNVSLSRISRATDSLVCRLTACIRWRYEGYRWREHS